MIQRMLAIWSLVPLPFLNPAYSAFLFRLSLQLIRWYPPTLCAVVHGVAKSRTRLSNWTELNWTHVGEGRLLTQSAGSDVSLIQKHPHRHIQDNAWSDVRVPVASQVEPSRCSMPLCLCACGNTIHPLLIFCRPPLQEQLRVFLVGRFAGSPAMGGAPLYPPPWSSYTTMLLPRLKLCGCIFASPIRLHSRWGVFSPLDLSQDLRHSSPQGRFVEWTSNRRRTRQVKGPQRQFWWGQLKAEAQSRTWERGSRQPQKLRVREQWPQISATLPDLSDLKQRLWYESDRARAQLVARAGLGPGQHTEQLCSRTQLSRRVR